MGQSTAHTSLRSRESALVSALLGVLSTMLLGIRVAPSLHSGAPMRRTIACMIAVIALSSCAGEAPHDPDPSDPDPSEPDEESTTTTISGPIEPGTKLKVCNATSLNQRSGPGTSYSILRALPGGAEVTVVATSGNWIRNNWNGKVGWSSAAYLCPVGGMQGTIWVPSPRTTWQWQLTGTVDESVDVEMIDIDLFDSSSALISRLETSGKKVICYFSAGSYESWRPDAAQFPAAVLGNPMDGWAGERWLNVKRIDLLMPIMKARLDLAVQKGCTGVEPDNVDVWTNNAEAGLSVTGADQLAYNRALAAEAHARGLSIGLKNDGDQASALVNDFDFAVNEQCMQYDECDALMVFIKANKAVFNCEYSTSLSAMCAEAAPRKFSSIKKSLSLGAALQTCN
jgi:hypothetical protein